MKPKRWMLLVAGFFLGLAAPCLGQHGSQWRVYRAADGLPETFAASISLGQHGNLWVRHPYQEWVGLLNGYEVMAIPGPGLGTSRIYESASGQIWSWTIEGLQRYQDKETGWVHYNLPEVNSYFGTNSSLNLYRQVPLYPIRQGHVLLLLPNALLECNLETPEHPKTTVMRDASQSGLQKFLGLGVSRDGGLWISGAKGLAKIHGPVRNLKPDSEWEEHLMPAELGIRNLHEPVEDDQGGVTTVAESLDGNRQVMAYFDGQKWTAQATREKLIEAWRGLDGTRWASTQTSLLEMKAGGKQFVMDESIPARRFLDVLVETNGVFWLATSDGVFRYAPSCWRISSDLPQLSTSISAVTEDREERIWVASSDSLSVLQNEHWTNYDFPPEFADNAREIRSMFALTNGMVALQAGNRVIEFEPASARFGYAKVPADGQVKLLGPLKDGALCAQLTTVKTDGGRSSQLLVFDGRDFVALPFPQPDLSASNETQTLCASQNGGLWLSDRKKIFYYHDKKWQTFTPSISSPSASIACMIEFAEGKIWCGIEDKIWEFDGNTWNLIHAGFEHVNGMSKTADGSIWVASENGLHRYYRGTWTANDTEEGLPSAAIRAICQDHHGRFWAATTSGLSEYHKEADPDPPRTYVQSLPEKNNTVLEGSIVSISFRGEDKWKYTPEDRLLYSYRLDGQDWSPYQEQRFATFLDLSAGKHTFSVRCMDRNWNVDPKPAKLDFAVALPWFRETRLLLISAAGLGAALFFAGVAFNRHRRLMRSYAEVEAKVALRTKQLELANQELFHSQKMNALGTLAAGIAHDFNNILSIIKGSAQIIETNMEDKDKIRVRTERIKTVVEQGAGIVKAMLGFSRTSDHQLSLCDINEVVSETIKLLGDRFLRETDVRFTPAASLPEVPASKDFIQQILLNFIFNAADAMMERRQVILSAAQSIELPQTMALKPAAADSYVVISVKDFGTGISPQIMPRIFEPFFTTKAFSTRRGTGLGLSMVYELARQMDGGLSVESTVGKGSVFMLILPVRDLPVDSPEKEDKLS